MTTYSDLGEWATATLKTASAVTVLVVAGAAGIMESGDLTSQDLEAAQKTRLDANGTKVLAVLVMDTGETNGQASCSVFVYDRGQGYTHIRAAREAVIATLLDGAVVLARNAHIVQVLYRGRTGHAVFEDFSLEYERVDFIGPLVIDKDIYT